MARFFLGNLPWAVIVAGLVFAGSYGLDQAFWNHVIPFGPSWVWAAAASAAAFLVCLFYEEDYNA